uniref:Uncharacterized protein n=1 Tax=Castor canadensis TaxID=51338 RepID=A0A8C0W968_CASCN
MVNEYKKIVLLTGLYHINDYQFRIIKSLLAHELKLTKKMQDDYDKIKIADLMEDKFRSDAGVDKLVGLFKSIPELEDLSETLKKEKLKGNRKVPLTPTLSTPSPTLINTPIWSYKDKTKKTKDSKRKQLTQEPSQRPEPSASGRQQMQVFPQTPHVPPAVPSTSSSIKKPRVTAVPKEPSNECGYHRECKEVMVLKATKPFIYEYLEGERSMFHATVATEKEFFRVKVFDISLKEKFIPNKIITISDYIGRNGFLEIYSLSCVDFASPDQKMNIPISLKQNANANPKIKYLCSQTKGKCVDGVFLVHKKTVRRGCTYYEIQDNTGKMEVVVYGRLTNIDCEEGDKLKLFCFELAFSTDKCQLRSVIHSYIEVGTLESIILPK